jgi:hypothetical protein
MRVNSINTLYLFLELAIKYKEDSGDRYVKQIKGYEKILEDRKRKETNNLINIRLE